MVSWSIRLSEFHNSNPFSLPVSNWPDKKDIVMAHVGGDSSVIGRVIAQNGQQYKLKIICQVGATYHNGEDNTIWVNDFEIKEILE